MGSSFNSTKMDIGPCLKVRVYAFYPHNLSSNLVEVNLKCLKRTKIKANAILKKL